MSNCLGPKDGELWGAPRCLAPAAYQTPSGPRCEACAEREMATIADGSCLLAILAEARGTSRETLLSRYVRIQ